MLHRRTSLLLSLSGLLLVTSVVLLSAPAVFAQCGSEASTCKDCHEVQGQDPVNNDGTSWHESHAFGDFCYICHAGNQQASTADAAHEGMVPPLSDVKASCQACHPNDLMDRAAVYATALGVSLDDGSVPLQPTVTTPPVSDAAPADTSAQPAEQAVANVEPTQVAPDCVATDTQLVVDDPKLVDYTQHYNETVLGEEPVNWGNTVLLGLIGLVALGGGGFVVVNETRRNRAATATIEGEYPAEVIELLPALTNLKSKSRKALERILHDPEKTDKVLELLDAIVADDETEE